MLETIGAYYKRGRLCSFLFFSDLDGPSFRRRCIETSADASVRRVALAQIFTIWKISLSLESMRGRTDSGIYSYPEHGNLTLSCRATMMKTLN